MHDFLFVTANEHEREAFQTRFVKHHEDYIKGKTYYLGKFGCYSAAYIHMNEQSYTNPAATPLVGELIRKLRPVAVIMVGIAFGANEYEQKIGDVLVSSKILPYDSAKLLNGKTVYKESPKEVGFHLLNAFSEHREWRYFLPNSKRSYVHIGSILTGSKLINDYEYRSQLLNDFIDEQPIGGKWRHREYIPFRVFRVFPNGLSLRGFVIGDITKIILIKKKIKKWQLTLL